MNASEFRSAMENFAKSRNIPLYDVLHDIDEVGAFAVQKPKDQQETFFLRAFQVYCQGFPTALPVGTTSLRRKATEEDDD